MSHLSIISFFFLSRCVFPSLFVVMKLFCVTLTRQFDQIGQFLKKHFGSKFYYKNNQNIGWLFVLLWKNILSIKTALITFWRLFLINSYFLVLHLVTLGSSAWTSLYLSLSLSLCLLGEKVSRSKRGCFYPYVGEFRNRAKPKKWPKKFDKKFHRTVVVERKRSDVISFKPVLIEFAEINLYFVSQYINVGPLIHWMPKSVSEIHWMCFNRNIQCGEVSLG